MKCIVDDRHAGLVHGMVEGQTEVVEACKHFHGLLRCVKDRQLMMAIDDAFGEVLGAMTGAGVSTGYRIATEPEVLKVEAW